MKAIWFIIVTLMLSIFIVLDGIDFGVGILHLYLARTNEERRQMLAAIGPFWNGNEVWLIAAGGTLVFAFPRVYSTGFSGFYLPLMMVLWLLILRGISIEFRSKENNTLWHTFWDSLFCLSSTIITFVLGAALGNIIRGVPIDATGYFAGALFTDFQPGKVPGVLDWYTVSVGLFALVVLAMHGALFLSWKTTGEIQERSFASAKKLWPVILVCGVAITYLTNIIRPELYQNLANHLWSWSFVSIIIISAAILTRAIRRQQHSVSLIASSCLILVILAATAAGMYPNMLISSVNSQFNITALNGSVNASTLKLQLIWFAPTIILAIAYFIISFRIFKAKTTTADSGH